jgi:hypothetical protein
MRLGHVLFAAHLGRAECDQQSGWRLAKDGTNAASSRA